jgi:hypothetical protein
MFSVFRFANSLLYSFLLHRVPLRLLTAYIAVMKPSSGCLLSPSFFLLCFIHFEANRFPSLDIHVLRRF